MASSDVPPLLGVMFLVYTGRGGSQLVFFYPDMYSASAIPSTSPPSQVFSQQGGVSPQLQPHSPVPPALTLPHGDASSSSNASLQSGSSSQLPPHPVAPVAATTSSSDRAHRTPSVASLLRLATTQNPGISSSQDILKAEVAPPVLQGPGSATTAAIASHHSGSMAGLGGGTTGASTNVSSANLADINTDTISGPPPTPARSQSQLNTLNRNTPATPQHQTHRHLHHHTHTPHNTQHSSIPAIIHTASMAPSPGSPTPQPYSPSPSRGRSTSASLPPSSPSHMPLDPALLATLLTPRPHLCGRKFVLSVDDIVFVGHPVAIGESHGDVDDLEREMDGMWDLDGKIDVGSKESVSSGKRRMSLGEPMLMSRRASLAVVPGGGPRRTSGADHSHTVDEGGHRGSDSVAIAQSIPGIPLSVFTPPPMDANTSGSSAPHVSASPSIHLTAFHIVFALRPTSTHPPTVQAERIYTTAVRKLALACAVEQRRRDYVRKEAGVMVGVRDDMGGEAGKVPTNTTIFLRELLQQSSLARLLAQVYHALVSPLQTTLHVRVGAGVFVSIKCGGFLSTKETEDHEPQPIRRGRRLEKHARLPSRERSDGDLSASREIGDKRSDYGQDDSQGKLNDLLPINQPLRPYQALLVLGDPEDVLEAMPKDAGRDLVQLVKAATPVENLQDLSRSLAWPLHHTFRLAAHLIHWEVTQILESPADVRNVYIVNRIWRVGELLNISPLFQQQFPSIPYALATIVSVLSAPVPFYRALHPLINGNSTSSRTANSTLHPLPESTTGQHSISTASTSAFGLDNPAVLLEVLVWLLRRGVITQLNMYACIKVPAKIQLRVLKRRAPSSIGQETATTETHHTGGELSASYLGSSSVEVPLFSRGAIEGVDLVSEEEDAHDDTPDFVISNPSEASPVEREWINEIALTSPEFGDWFLRIADRLDAKCHLDQIMFEECVPRNIMRPLLLAFTEYLLITTAEEAI
ncbi:hypothetical protein M427DRAFT_426083 [Gonapodya prolifera JEL478]|uniref:Nitrogen permease regulator 3 n=1 Tax=Gonapodya prolifera (strain JEL478) TaxID=1344416 RepID=A0A139A4A8_GONPJ|nr:hypothetical protein M427DRAFT_426083 [Gonapodya prolifera JEL478]|eukprot:KXS11657.1 hypothetical protein M427DRAFT_426083 [Gonapodya prolifera JEL478]